jgi:GAF domain-containing protein
MSRAGTTLADVLSGGLPYAVGETSGQGRLVVPLRVAGRIHGALLFTAPLTIAWNEEHVRAAQSLADIVASHIDLLRRSTFRAPPYVPGWRRAEKSS